MPFSKDPLALIYFSLSDETRLRVVRVMATAGSSTYLSELAAALEVPISKLSKHVNLLAWAGIIQQERSGSWVLLSLTRNTPHLEHLYSSVMTLPDQGEVFSTDLARFHETKKNSH